MRPDTSSFEHSYTFNNRVERSTLHCLCPATHHHNRRSNTRPGLLRPLLVALPHPLHPPAQPSSIRTPHNTLVLSNLPRAQVCDSSIRLLHPPTRLAHRHAPRPIVTTSSSPPPRNLATYNSPVSSLLNTQYIKISEQDISGYHLPNPLETAHT